jgi:hypothetical protein
MYSLFLGDENAANRFFLHGPGVEPPILGAVRQSMPQALDGGLVEEIIRLECKGGDMRGLTAWLEQQLTLAQNGIQPLYLWLRTTAESTPIGAEVRRGQLELAGGGSVDRLNGYQGLTLRLVRRDVLSELAAGVPLQNANGVNNTAGLALYNHADGGSGHVNFCDVPGSAVRGSQPLPARLLLDVTGAQRRRLGKIAIGGGRDLWDETGSFAHVLEGEAAAAGAGCTSSSATASVAASGGYYQVFQWTAVEETPLLSWTVNSGQLGWLKGRGLRPVARFHALPPGNSRLRWRILDPGSGSLLDQSAQTLLDPQSRLQILPAFFPPVLSAWEPYQAFILEAWLECSTAGIKQIDLDFVHLFPIENFALLQPLSGIEQDHSLVLDWVKGEFFTESLATGEKSVTHTLTGSPLTLMPGRNHRIYLLVESDAGFSVSDTVHLRLQAGPRWILP